ncbi:MAG: class I SAM-dependent methyltransferase [Candidatus Methanomethylophilaceae archaeon]|nr:class I SAM-dependent methyltransferase [Candidatus Methanomethylophilaceae archaeon]
MSKDWNSVWNHEVSTTSRKNLDKDGFWDDRVESVRKNSMFAEMTDWQLSLISAGKDDTCLDIGCGTGRLAIPLAKTCRKVTAIDGSQPMLDALRAETEVCGVSNIDIVHSTWQAFTPDSDYDIAFASFSIFMENVRKHLQRMADCSERGVVFASDDLRMSAAAQLAVFNSIVSTHTDIEMIRNVCVDLGLEPDFETRTFKRQIPEETEEQAASRLAEIFNIDADDPNLLRYIRSDYRKEHRD